MHPLYMATTPSTEGVLHKSIQGGKWLTIGTFIQRCIGFASFFILARMFTPSDFGVIAIMFLVPNILNATTETGFGSAAVQKGGDIKPYLDPLWTIGVLKSIAIAVIIFLTGPLIATFLNAENALLAIRLGGISIVLYNLANIGEMYFSKDLDFKKIVIRNISKDTAYAVTALIGAYYYRSYWVLIIATYVSYAVYALSTYILHPYRPKISFAFSRLRDLVQYSKWVVGQSWLDQIYGFLEPIIVASSTNVKSVGLYSKGKSVASVAPGFLGPMLNIISFPAYSKLKESPEKIREGFVKSLDILFFVLIPVNVLLQFSGAKLVHIFLGDQWAAITPILQAMSIFYLFNSLGDLMYVLFNAIGKPKLRLELDTIKIFFTLILIIYLTNHLGIFGTALALIFGLLPSLLLSLRRLTQVTAVTIKDVIGSVWVPFCLSLLLSLPALLWREQIIQLPIIVMISLVVITGLAYISLTWILGKHLNAGPYKTLRLILQHILPKTKEVSSLG